MSTKQKFKKAQKTENQTTEKKFKFGSIKKVSSTREKDRVVAFGASTLCIS